MITNERQYRITKAQLARIREAIEAFDIHEASRRVGSSRLAKAELDALESEQEVLATQLRDYDSLKSGDILVLKARNLDELPTILIRARIARGYSQRELAERLGLTEQQVQRYEAEEYASASLRRLSRVAEALDLDIHEHAELRPAT